MAADCPSRGRKRSEEFKRRVGDAARNRSEETLAKMSKSQMGNQRTLGYRHTEESKRKMSEAMMGNTHTLGHTLSEEHKRKIGEANMGNQYALGYKHSEETKQRMSTSQKARWAKRKSKAAQT